MKNMYEEMSKGAYTVARRGHPVGHGAALRGLVRRHTLLPERRRRLGRRRDPGHAGPPGQPARRRPAARSTRSTALAAAQPDFPWADYDIEDQGDVDGDGNFLEPDGVIDHVVLVHAGEDKSGGGGAEGTYAIWAHSSAVAGGATIPGTDLKLSQLHRAARGLRRRRLRPRVRPRPRPAGPVRHLRRRRLRRRLLGPDELRLALRPDLPVDADAHGPLGQVGARLGRPGRSSTPVTTATHGQGRPDARAPPKGTEDGIKINLPDKVITLADAAQRREHVVLRRRPGLGRHPAHPRPSPCPPARRASFWMWNNYVIEEDWDFGFVEVSTDGGTTWTEQKVYNEAGTVVTTPDGYADPNGRHGSTTAARSTASPVSTDGWQHDYVDLAAVRRADHQACACGYATDAAFQERGWFADDFALTSGGTTVWCDDVESGDNGWTADGRARSRHHRRRLAHRHAARPPTPSTTWSSGATSTASTRA